MYFIEEVTNVFHPDVCDTITHSLLCHLKPE